MKRPVNDSIVLTEPEANIREVLVDYCNYYNTRDGVEEPLELRITGGWVRDKLLGNESHDIDIAVNHLTGEEFAHNLHDYLLEREPELSMKAIHTIKKNPEKSKHLETCTTKLFGVDIDFVNLRSEEYTHESRVPVIEFGSPEEDALRRDATLNALFYNLNQNKIEDFTGKGLEDLHHGLLRTPLPPLQTFLDDPLRIIRLIRFASKYNFILEPRTLSAMKDKQSQVALSTKISKERIEIELRKVLTSKNAGYGLQLINYTGLAPFIFHVASMEKIFNKEQIDACRAKIPDQITLATIAYSNLKHFILGETRKLKHALADLIISEDHMNIFWLAIILQPYAAIRPSRLITAIGTFMKDGLKSKRLDIVRVQTIATAYSHETDVLSRFFKDPESIKRSELGLYLRQFGDYTEVNLMACCMLDCIYELKSVFHIPEELPVPYPEHSKDLYENKEINEVIHKIVLNYEKLFKRIEELELKDVHLVKPLIDGTTLSKYLGLKPGPWLKDITDDILIWQLDNKEAGKDECLEYVDSVAQTYNPL
ncbi:CCA1 [[Candida] subhashii]|uniref:CCA tRNA nucleotidyltransferase, mitochondrial n=1 Tax=[Candida] subhashii TaxID=561895 RepID=A0A8J5QIB9_9ASCO|nr:CCA1 [[Candida] subhashii]KAG7665166.1 CCA1 [[Candida] subhashii]